MNLRPLQVEPLWREEHLLWQVDAIITAYHCTHTHTHRAKNSTKIRLNVFVINTTLLNPQCMFMEQLGKEYQCLREMIIQVLCSEATAVDNNIDKLTQSVFSLLFELKSACCSSCQNTDASPTEVIDHALTSKRARLYNWMNESGTEAAKQHPQNQLCHSLNRNSIKKFFFIREFFTIKAKHFWRTDLRLLKSKSKSTASSSE